MSTTSLPVLSYNSDGYPDSWAKLELTSRDPSRTEVIDAKDPQKVVYKSTTDESGRNPVTTYADASGNVLTTLEWHLRLSDKLSLRAGSKQKVGKWLKRAKRNGKKTASFSTEGGSNYRWELSEDGRLHFFAEDDATTPIAIFLLPVGNKYRDPNATNAAIVYSERATVVRDELVLSALLLERARRLSTKDSISSNQYSSMGLMSLGLY